MKETITVTVTNYLCDCCKRKLSENGKPKGAPSHIHFRVKTFSLSEYNEDSKKWLENNLINDKELQFCDLDCMKAYFENILKGN